MIDNLDGGIEGITKKYERNSNSIFDFRLSIQNSKFEMKGMRSRGTSIGSIDHLGSSDNLIAVMLFVIIVIVIVISLKITISWSVECEWFEWRSECTDRYRRTALINASTQHRSYLRRHIELHVAHDLGDVALLIHRFGSCFRVFC